MTTDSDITVPTQGQRAAVQRAIAAAHTKIRGDEPQPQMNEGYLVLIEFGWALALSALRERSKEAGDLVLFAAYGDAMNRLQRDIPKDMRHWIVLDDKDKRLYRLMAEKYMADEIEAVNDQKEIIP